MLKVVTPLQLEASIILNSLMAFFSLVMLGLAIWAAILCWKGKEGEMTVDVSSNYLQYISAHRPQAPSRPKASCSNDAKLRDTVVQQQRVANCVPPKLLS